MRLPVLHQLPQMHPRALSFSIVLGLLLVSALGGVAERFLIYFQGYGARASAVGFDRRAGTGIVTSGLPAGWKYANCYV